MTTEADYPEDLTQRVFAELGEVLAALGAYRDCIYVVGGWVPYLATIASDPGEPHCRSLDIDLLVDPPSVPERAYESIRRALERRGFSPRADLPHRLSKSVALPGGGLFPIAVDLLAPERGAAGRGRRHQRIQEAHARKAKGGDLVARSFERREVDFALPGGGRRRIEVRFASPSAFLVMKAAALRDRANEKDAYDAAYVVEHHPIGVEGIRSEFRRLLPDPVVEEALATLGEWFADVESPGAAGVAAFRRYGDPDELERRKRRVVELFRELRFALTGREEGT